MTSLLHKSRRITVRPVIRLAKTSSRRLLLAGLTALGIASVASAQAPVPPGMGRPAPTQWGQYGSTPTAPDTQRQPIASTIPPSAPIGTRVITNPNQVPQTITPVQAPVVPKKDPMPAGTDTQKINPNDVFRIQNDTDLNDRFLKESEKIVTDHEAELNKWMILKQLYEIDHKKWELTKIGAEPKVPVKPELFPVSSGETAPVGTRNSRLNAAPLSMQLVPGLVVHRRLYFEDLNSERYGWNLGLAQPIISSAYFYKDILLLPSKMASNLFENYDTNMGKCLPGSPVPYKLYPPDVTLFGLGAGASLLVGAAFLFP